jgi:hypothetical protein
MTALLEGSFSLKESKSPLLLYTKIKFFHKRQIICMIFYTRSAAADGGVPNFSGFLLRLSDFADFPRLCKVRAFQIAHNVTAVYDDLAEQRRGRRCGVRVL